MYRLQSNLSFNFKIVSPPHSHHKLNDTGESTLKLYNNYKTTCIILCITVITFEMDEIITIIIIITILQPRRQQRRNIINLIIDGN